MYKHTAKLNHFVKIIFSRQKKILLAQIIFDLKMHEKATITYLDDDIRRKARTDPIIPIDFGRAALKIITVL